MDSEIVTLLVHEIGRLNQNINNLIDAIMTKKKEPDLERYVKLPEAARVFGVSCATMRKLCKNGTVPYTTTSNNPKINHIIIYLATAKAELEKKYNLDKLSNYSLGKVRQMATKRRNKGLPVTETKELTTKLRTYEHPHKKHRSIAEAGSTRVPYRKETPDGERTL